MLRLLVCFGWENSSEGEGEDEDAYEGEGHRHEYGGKHERGD